MHREGEEIHVSPTEARAGRKGSFLLQVLLISLAVVLLVMGALWVFGAGTSDNTGGPVPAETATIAP